MTTLNMHPEIADRELRRAFLQAASDFLTARARRRAGDRVRARPRLEGLEDRCLLSVTITEYTVPTANALLGNGSAITAGPDGNLWFTESGASQIGMINPANDHINEFAIPTDNAAPRGITAGPDGNVWFTEFGASRIGMINPTTHVINEFATASGPWGITAGPDGNLWFADYGATKVGEINPATHVINEFPVQYAPEGICAGPDGNLWFTEPYGGGGQIGRISPATHAVNEFSVASGGYPLGICAGPDGNLWFTQATGNIGMITTAGTTTEFPDSTNSGYPARICAGPDGNLWFSEAYGGSIATFNPATAQAVTRYAIPYANAGAWGITAGPDSNLWFADSGTNAVGLATLATSQLVVTAQPPASVTAGSSFGLTVQAEDSSGNLITSFNGPVAVGLASNPGGATLGGTLTVTASGGVATFSGLTLTKAASGYTLAATTSGLGQGVTNAMTVTPASPTQLVITQQPPATVKVSSPFTVKASIEDAYGNVVTTASSSVSVALANNPTGATLGGTLTVAAGQGVASFTNLTINKVGSGYTLQVTSTGLTSATSNPINVTKTGKAPSTLYSAPGTTASDLSLAPLVLDSPDLWDGFRFKKRLRSS
jgi:streptogramin lyase